MSGKRLLIELYYDVVSPYTYLAFEALCRYRRPWNIELDLKPFLLGAVMNKAGSSTPALVPNKARYCLQDLHRLSRYYGVPLGLHEDYVEWVLTRNTLQAQRFLCALKANQPEYLEQTSRKFFQRLFAEQKEIMSMECVPEVAKSACVPDEMISHCLKAIKTDEVKNMLKKYTDEALQMQAFGSPTIVAHINGRKEVYFGQDRLLLLAHDANKKWLGPWPEQI